MKAIVMNGFGGPELARLDDMPMPECKERDVLIRVVAAGVNPVDWKVCAGLLEPFYGEYQTRWVPGYDAAGIVEAVGADVRDFKPGDRVVAFSDRRENGHNGTFAEFVRVMDDAVALVPDGIDLADAAAIPTAGLTSYQALHRQGKAGLERGGSVLIHGASGGMGSYAVPMARAAGLTVAASCSARNLDYVRRLGADLAIDYAAGPIAPAIRQWRPDGLDAIIDCVSGGSLASPEEILRPGGRLVSIATLTQDGDIVRDTEQASRKGYAKIFSIMEFDRIGAELAEVLALMLDGSLPPPPLTRYPLAEAAAALQRMKDGGVRGKIVLTSE